MLQFRVARVTLPSRSFPAARQQRPPPVPTPDRPQRTPGHTYRVAWEEAWETERQYAAECPLTWDFVFPVIPPSSTWDVM